MKTLLKSLCLLTIMLLSLTAAAQTPVFDVNGLVIGENYTKAQIVAKLGDPVRYYSWPGDYQGIGEEYNYGKDIFRFYDGGIFEAFTITSKKNTVLNGKIKVGENISSLYSIPNCRFILKSEVWPNEQNISDLYVSYYDTPILITHANGLITTIVYSTSM